jgi:hypothetical protein
MTATYSVDDEFGNQIATDLASYSAAVDAAQRYLSSHDDAPAITIYTDDESWDLGREQVLR